MSNWREVVVFTANYAVEPMKVVYDSHYSCYKRRFQTGMDAARFYRNKPAEDSEVRFFMVSGTLSNEALVKTLNSTMEIFIQ